jgi:fumarylacetoacetate (FAA) hydrolase
MPQAWYELPAFSFSNPNSLVGQDAEVFSPASSTELDYGLELAVVMGDWSRNVVPEQAWKHVAGFTILNDFSARDLQRLEMAIGLGPAKGRDFATAVGPVLVTRDELTDKIDGERIALQMRARVNGHEISHGNSKGLFHTFPRMIAHAARDAELFPGDLISSGTVGAGCILELTPEATNGWLKPGDVVELEIERLGKLRTKIAARPV